MLNLEDLKVQSFVTVLDSEHAKNIKGGDQYNTDALETMHYYCQTGAYDQY